jgi:hypothetical protein
MGRIIAGLLPAITVALILVVPIGIFIGGILTGFILICILTAIRQSN